LNIDKETIVERRVKKMLKNISIVSILCVMIIALPAWALDLKPGKYEITTKVEMQGMPGTMPSQTMTQCLTEQDPVPASSADAQGCKVTDMKTEGNTLTYTMTCEQQGMTMKSSGKMTYKGDTFEGTNQTRMGPDAGNMIITTQISGKRIGKCE
jgi:hypothetical protein